MEAGAIRNAADVEHWLADLIGHGSIRADTMLAAMAWNAAKAGDFPALGDINALALALAGGRERALETSAQGNAFIAAALAAWPCAVAKEFRATVSGSVAYPVALGLLAGGHHIPLRATLEAFALAFTSMLISAAVRLGAIGQTQAQQITARLLPLLQILAEETQDAAADNPGTCAFHSDISALQHETQYSRLFRS